LFEKRKPEKPSVDEDTRMCTLHRNRKKEINHMGYKNRVRHIKGKKAEKRAAGK